MAHWGRVMSKIEKTVFISYRRTDINLAQAIYQNLTQHGYDAFLDNTGINSGDFEQIIMENIKSRAHFIIVLTPSALERVHEPGDWLRREIETAMDIRRNIIPLTFENFDWKHAKEKYLTGKLAVLSNYNALRVPMDYFDEGMDKLRSRYLNIPLNMVLHPMSAKVEQATEVQQQEADAQPTVSAATLTAEAWFEKGNQYIENKAYEEAIKAYTEALRLQSDYAVAYNNRGTAKYNMDDLAGALTDYDAALRLQPDLAIAYTNRGLTKDNMGDSAGALVDYDEAIFLKPDLAIAYNNRGWVKYNMGDNAGALADYDEALRLQPDLADAYNNRGWMKHNKADYAGAIVDYETALRWQPNHTKARINLQNAWLKLNESK
jgi:tetratricopeptide (TPR) repeat protein